MTSGSRLTIAATSSSRSGGTCSAASVLAPTVFGRTTAPMREITPISCRRRKTPMVSRLVERRGAADDLEGFVDQREIMLPAIDQCQFGGIRAHCPILVARAVKKMPDGFCAEICPFFAKVAVS